MRDIHLSDISRHRAAIMGIAMICIILFHVGVPRNDAFYGVCRMGNIGVDIFLFLSGIGLWYSWTREPSKRQTFFRRWLTFYWRRLRRVYPAWIIVSAAFYIPRFMARDSHSAAEWADLFGDVLLNWDFWLNDELTFWYIPATMMLYIFAPPYMALIRRLPDCRWLVVAAFMWCIIVQYVTPIHNAVGHIEIFWSRVPVFFLGINIASGVKADRTLHRHMLWLIILLFAMSLSACVWLEQMRHGRFPLFVERMLYIPLAVSFVLLLTQLLNRTPRSFNKAMIWVGGISLETYLLHIEFVMRDIKAFHLGYWPTALLTITITLPIAWLLHKAIDKALKPSGNDRKPAA